jgi:hypothetical protein
MLILIHQRAGRTPVMDNYPYQWLEFQNYCATNLGSPEVEVRFILFKN